MKKVNESEVSDTTKPEEHKGSTNDEPEFVKQAPDEYKNIWRKLTESAKTLLINQANNRMLENKEQIANFWATRNFEKLLEEAKHVQRMQKVEPVNESVSDPLAKICSMLRS